MCMCDSSKEPSIEELAEARRQIDSIVHKLEKTVQTIESKEEPQRYRSQITLAHRRIKDLTIALGLIEKEMKTI